jgi:DNA-binding HxlR family transcriptional regulator
MYAEQIAFTRVCRIIANQTRLHLLWTVMDDLEKCVALLATTAGISEHNASHQLNILQSCHLVIPHRKENRVIYMSPETSPDPFTRSLLVALKTCKANQVSFDTIIKQATAFTHDRRIQIARCLSSAEHDFDSLVQKTGMTVPALTRHLRKLIRRNVVEKKGTMYRLIKPLEALSACLLKQAVR